MLFEIAYKKHALFADEIILSRTADMGLPPTDIKNFVTIMIMHGKTVASRSKICGLYKRVIHNVFHLFL